MPTQRGQSWQGVVYHQSLPGGRARRNFDTKDEAAAWEMESRAKLLRGQPIDMGENAKAGAARKAGEPYTLAELIQHVAATHWKGTAAETRQLRNAEMIGGIIGMSRPFASITKLDIDKARGVLLEQGNSHSTVNKKVSALSLCLTQAAKSGLLASKPLIDRYRTKQGRIRRFTPEEEQFVLTFFERISMPDMVDYVILSLDTGMRQGEVLNLRFDDCDGDKVTVWGTGAKSGRTRSIPLTNRAKAVLARRSVGKRPSTRVLDGWNRFQITDQWQKPREALGLLDDRDFVPHVMRHEFCSRLADRGLNAAVIKELAGHSSLAVTQIYIHIKADALVAAIKTLELA